jgi:hypothetical protein
VLCQVPRSTGADRSEGWVGVSVGAAAGRISGSGFVRWKVRLHDRNVYLRFPGLAGKLADGEPTDQALPTTLPGCANRAQLNRQVDASTP